jgi:hypothetical protein
MEIKGMVQLQAKLSKLRVAIPLALTDTLREVSTIGQTKAKETLKSTNHTQKYGDELVNQIGVTYNSKTAKVYTPITKTSEMRAQMQYAEFGAGIGSKKNTESEKYFNAPPQSAKAMDGKKWYYYTTPSDKNPNPATPSRYTKGKFVKSTNTSEPARFMYNARRTMKARAKDILVKNIKSRI